MSERAKKWILTSVRLVVCAVALAWVLYNVTYHDYVTLADGSEQRGAVEDRDGVVHLVGLDGTTAVFNAGQIARNDDGTPGIRYGLKSTWVRARKGVLILCLAIFFPVPLIQSLRFQWMLRAQEIAMGYWECVKLSYAGNFLNFLTPLGTTGGDVFKMYYASLHTDRRTEAVTTVILDRIVGLYGLVLLASSVLVVRASDTRLHVLLYGIGVLVIGGLLAAVLLFSERCRALVKPQHLLGKLPFAAHLQRAEAATRRLRHHKPLVIGSLVCTLTLQGLALTSFVTAARAMDMRWEGSAIWDYYALIAAGLFIAAIPVSPQGLGTMEAFYKYIFLGTYGTLAQLLCLALSVRVIQLFWSLPGVLVTLTGSYRPRRDRPSVPSTRGDASSNAA